MSALVTSSVAGSRPTGFASRMVTDAALARMRNGVVQRARRLTAVIPADNNFGAERLKAANIGDNQDWATRRHQNIFDELPTRRRWRVVRIDLTEKDKISMPRPADHCFVRFAARHPPVALETAKSESIPEQSLDPLGLFGRPRLCFRKVKRVHGDLT
jgi:hypothetical protein